MKTLGKNGITDEKRGLYELVGEMIMEIPMASLDKGADRQWVVGNQEAIDYYGKKAIRDAKKHLEGAAKKYKAIGIAMNGFDLVDIIGGVKASIVTLKGSNLSCGCSQFAGGGTECRHMALVRKKKLH